MYSPEQEVTRERSSQGSEAAHPDMLRQPSPTSTPDRPPLSPPLSPDTYAGHTSALLDPSLHMSHHMSHRRRRKQDADVARGLQFSPQHQLFPPPRSHHAQNGPSVASNYHEQVGMPAQETSSSSNFHPGWASPGHALGRQAGSLTHAASSSALNSAYRPGDGTHIPPGSGVHAKFGSGLSLQQLGLRRESDGYPSNAAGAVAQHALHGSNGMQRAQSLPFRGASHHNSRSGRHSLALPGAFMREPNHRKARHQAGSLDVQHRMSGMLQHNTDPWLHEPRECELPDELTSEALPEIRDDLPMYQECPGMVQHGPGIGRHGMIASLHPSSTDILLALGLSSRIGAVSADSAWLPEAASLPHLNLKAASPSSKVNWSDAAAAVAAA